MTKLTLEEMVKFVREVAECALEDKREIDAGVLVQAANGDLRVLMFPVTVEEAELVKAIREFFSMAIHEVQSYVYMSAMTGVTREIKVYAAEREGDRKALRWEVAGKRLVDHPADPHPADPHQLMELLPRTLN